MGVYPVTGDGDLGNVNMATLTHVAPSHLVRKKSIGITWGRLSIMFK